MHYLKPFWSFLLSHGLIFLATAILFLMLPEDSPEEELFFLAMFLFLAAIIQGIILWKRKREGFKWLWPLLVILADIVLGILILYAPAESLRIYIMLLTLWSALVGILLLSQFSIKKPLRASMAAAGVLFMIISVYLLLQLDDLDYMDPLLLGIVSLVFSLFLIVVALQLRFYKIPLPLEDLQDNRSAHSK